VAERKQTNFRRISDRVAETSYEIDVRNRKKERVTVIVIEHPQGDWDITQKTSDFTKKDSQTVEFPVTVEPGGEVKLTYTVRTTS
jgi:hypothetical protein